MCLRSFLNNTSISVGGRAFIAQSTYGYLNHPLFISIEAVAQK